jgi:ribose 5-phosphate isomerase B
MSNIPVFIASDHRGLDLKTAFLGWLKEKGFSVRDLGTNSADRCDVGDYAQKMAVEMAKNKEALGVLICGSGQASAMTANRYKHIRAALCTDVTMARLSREHNDANILVLGAHIVGLEVALDCLDVFLKTKFLGGRYAERRDKLTALGGL